MKNYVVDATAAITVEKMIQQLAGVCDGAAAIDGQGFSRFDTQFGHSLAHRSKQGVPWSIKQATCAVSMLRKYQGQLGGKEFMDRFLVQPVFASDPVDHAKTQSTEKVHNDRVIALQTADSFSIKFRYDAAVVADIKQCFRKQHNGKTFWATWNGTCWTVPLNSTSYQLLQQFASKHGFAITQEVHDANHAYMQLAKKHQEDSALLRLNDGCNVQLVGDELVVAIEDQDMMKQFAAYLKL